MILVVHAAATWFMTGLIWFVQIVHYPLFAAVGRDHFAPFAIRHSRLTTLVVGPMMLIELLSGVAVLFVEGLAPTMAALAGLGLLGVIWISTAVVQVPLHAVLSRGFEEGAHRRLVATNWVRTAAWSLRAALVSWLLMRPSGN